MEIPPGGGSGPPLTTRIALLDEYPLWLSALTDGLEAQVGFLVTLVALTGAALMQTLDRQRLDVLVLEPWLRSGDGLDAIQHAKSAIPDITVVAFSRIWDDRHVQPVMDLGVAAYVPKATPVATLRSVIAGAQDGMLTRPKATEAMAAMPVLTPREVEVLALVAEGNSNQAVAERLFVTERTVRFHLRNIYAKLGAGNRTMAVAVARKTGIIP